MGARERRRNRERRVANANLIGNLCREIAGIAQREYPWYAWGVRPSGDGSTIELLCTVRGLSTEHGWVFHTDRIQDATGRKGAVVWACGEILERYGLPRHRFGAIADIVKPENVDQRRRVVMDGVADLD